MAFEGKHKSRYAGFSRRTLLLSGGMSAIFGVLAARLYQLQIVNGERYLTEAEDNRINLRLLAPPRGRIFDRFGVALANSRRNYRVMIVPEQTRRGVGAALDALAEVIALDEHTRARVMKEAVGNKPFMPIVVAENLSWDEFARVNLDLPYLPGVQPDEYDVEIQVPGSELWKAKRQKLGTAATRLRVALENESDLLTPRR